MRTKLMLSKITGDLETNLDFELKHYVIQMKNGSLIAAATTICYRYLRYN